MLDRQQLHQTLEGIGLSEKEVQTYLAALSLGPTSAQELSRTSGVKRTTIYGVIERLVEKGLLHHQLQGIKLLVVAESPRKLFELYDAKRSALKNCINGLLTLQKYENTENAVRYFDGMGAIKGVYNSLLEDCEAGADYLIISNQESWYELAPSFFQDFIERRARLNLRIRNLLLDSPIAREHRKLQVNYNETIKLLPTGMHFDANVVIIPRRVMIHQLVPPVFAMTVDNKNVVGTVTALFDIIWALLSD